MKRIEFGTSRERRVCGPRGRCNYGARRKARSRRQMSPQAPAAAAPTQPTPSGEIVITGSRIRRDPLNQNAPVVFVDKQRFNKTGLSAIADVLQRIPSASGGLNTQGQRQRQPRQPARRRRRRRRFGDDRPALSRRQPHPGAGRRPALRQRHERERHSGLGRPQHHPDQHDRSDRGAAVRRVAALRFGRDRRRRQHHHRAAAGRPARLGSIWRVQQGRRQDPGLSGELWHPAPGARASSFGGNYAKQKPVFSRDRSISQFPNPFQTDCGNGGGGCSSASANGRFITAYGTGSDTISGPPDSTPTFAELRHFTTADRFNFAPYQYILTPNERYGGWASVKTELTDDINFRVRGLYNRRNSENKAAFEPLFIGPDAGNGAGSLFDTLSFDATNPYNPFGVNGDRSPNVTLESASIRTARPRAVVAYPITASSGAA